MSIVVTCVKGPVDGKRYMVEGAAGFFHITIPEPVRFDGTRTENVHTPFHRYEIDFRTHLAYYRGIE